MNRELAALDSHRNNSNSIVKQQASNINLLILDCGF